MITKEQLAARINGRTVGSEITSDEETMARESGLLVVFGYSDDVVELRGLIHDEQNVRDGEWIHIDPVLHKLIEPIDEDDEEILEKYDVLDVVAERYKKAHKIKCDWCEVEGYSWTYQTSLEHATFDVMEESLEDGKYCRGIIIDLTHVVKL